MLAEAIDPTEQRLHALLDLLIATGTDNTDDNHQQKHLDDKVARFKSIHLSSITLPESRQPDDHLIEEIIGQLRKANNDKFDDDFLECLEAEPIPLALRQSTLKLVTRPDPLLRSREEEAIMQQEPISAPPPSADQLREFMEREDSYPRIGPGYSDEISVVSDLTIPTVVNGVPIPEEEYYGAPRQLPLNLGTGGGNNMKRRNLVNAVKPQQPSLAMGTPPPPPRRSQMPPGQGPPQQMPVRGAKAVQRPGGAAAKRLKNYEQTMAKLGDGGGNSGGNSGGYANEFDFAQDNDGSNFYMEAANNGFGADWDEDAGQQMMGAKKRSPVPTRSKKPGISPLAKSNVNQSIDMGRSPSKGSRTQKDLEWQPPFGSPAFQSPKSGGEDPLLIDEDGFLVSEQAGDPFKSTADPFAGTTPDPFGAVADPFVKQRSFGSTNAGDPFGRGYADNAFPSTNDPFQKAHKSPARPARAGRRMSNEMEYTMESEWAAEPDPRSRRAPVNQGGRPRRAGPQ